MAGDARSTRSKRKATRSAEPIAAAPAAKKGKERAEDSNQLELDSQGSLTDLSDAENDASSDGGEDEDEQESLPPSESEDEPGEDDDQDDEYMGSKRKKGSPAKKKKTAAAAAGTPKRAKSGAQGTKNATGKRLEVGRGAAIPKARRVGTGAKKLKGVTMQAKGAGSKEVLSINEDNTLFNSVKDPNTALQSTAEDWVVSYQEDEGAALAQLINFVIRTSGCNGSVDHNLVQDLDAIVDNLDDVQEVFKKEPIPSYPIVSRAKDYKKFRKSLAEFIERLIASAAEAEILFDETFMETFQAWVSAMSSSSLRSFRHTATVIALWTISSVSAVSEQARKDFSTASRQRDAEKKKGRTDKTRLKALEEKVEQAHSVKIKVDSYLEELVNSVFVHRFRDSDPGIRSECVQELGNWMKKFPEQFLQGSYFRYLGWVLSDNDASVRMAAAKATAGLYNREEFSGSIRHFTEMFKGRLVEMAIGDIDLSVRIATIALLVSIDKHSMLDDEQRDSLATHIFDINSRVRVAVAGFVAGMLDELVEDSTAELETRTQAGSSKKGAQALAHEAEVAKLRVKCLASLLVKFGHRLDKLEASASNAADDALSQAASIRQTEELASTVDGAREGRIGMAIEALWDEVDIVRQWQPVIDILLLDHSEDSEPSNSAGSSGARRPRAPVLSAQQPQVVYRLETEEEAVLVETLVAILRKTQQQALRNKLEDDTSQADMTRAMIPALPRLFAKYQTDAPRIADVLLIPQVMDLDMYLEVRAISAYESLWDDISRQFLRHVEPTLLKHAVEALRCLVATQTLSNTNATKSSALEEQLVTALRETASGRDVETAGFSEDEVHALAACLLRLHMLFQSGDLTSALEEEDGGKLTSGWDIIVGLASRGRLGYREEEKMIEDALKVLSLYVMWKTRRGVETDPGADANAVEALQQKRTLLLDLMNEFVVGTQSNACSGVRRVAFERLLTIHLMYATLPGGGGPADVLGSMQGNARLPTALRIKCSDEVQARCSGFVQAEIERFIDQQGHADAEAHESDEEQERSSDGEDAENDEATPKKKKAPSKKSKRVAPRPSDWPTQAQLEAEHVFCSTISIYVRAIRIGVIEARHSPVVLAHYGRLGHIYDQCCKVLVDVLREEGVYGDHPEMVCQVVFQSLRESFEQYLDDGASASEDAVIALARQLSSALCVRGAQLAIVKRLDARQVIRLHTLAIEYIIKKVSQYERNKNKVLKNRTPALFRALAHLLPSALPRDALSIKSTMDQALKDAELEIPTTAKAWEPQRAYDKRLVTLASKDQNLAKSMAKSGAKSGSKPTSASAQLMDGDSDLSEPESEQSEQLRPSGAMNGSAQVHSSTNAARSPRPTDSAAEKGKKRSRDGETLDEGEQEQEAESDEEEEEDGSRASADSAVDDPQEEQEDTQLTLSQLKGRRKRPRV